jgi:hypothetical protein
MVEQQVELTVGHDTFTIAEFAMSGKTDTVSKIGN